MYEKPVLEQQSPTSDDSIVAADCDEIDGELQRHEFGLLQRVEPERAHEGHVDAERAVHAGALDAVDCTVLRAQPLVSDDAAVAVEADVVALDFEGGEHCC